jgi:predicted  nucleic acid-binding Zn-ribbon protein
MNTGFSNTDKRIDSLNDRVDSLGDRMDGISDRVDSLSDRIEMHDKSNKEEFKQVSIKLDGITDAVAQTMENVTELKDKVEKQDVEIRVIKGGK